MAKKRQNHGGTSAPLNRLYAAIDTGDNRLAHQLADQILQDPESPEAARTEARKIDRGLKMDWVALAFVIGGVTLWTVAFVLGVLARR